MNQKKINFLNLNIYEHAMNYVLHRDTPQLKFEKKSFKVIIIIGMLFIVNRSTSFVIHIVNNI